MSTLKPSHIEKRAICDGFSVSTALFFNHFLQCRETVVKVTNKSKEFNNFGFNIIVPENSLPEGSDTCNLHIILYPLTYPLTSIFPLTQNCSVQLKCEPQLKFKKPLTLEIQHCASLSSYHQQRLVFARATDQNKKFEILESGHFPIGKCYGSIQLTRFSCFGIFVVYLNSLIAERWKNTQKMYSALFFPKIIQSLKKLTLNVFYMLGPRNTCKGKCHMQFAIWYPWQCYIEVSFLQAIKEALKDDGFTK